MPDLEGATRCIWKDETAELAQLKASLKQVQTQVKLDKIAEFTDSMGLFQADASKKVEALAAVHAETQAAIPLTRTPNLTPTLTQPQPLTPTLTLTLTPTLTLTLTPTLTLTLTPTPTLTPSLSLTLSLSLSLTRRAHPPPPHPAHSHRVRPLRAKP